MTNSTRQLTDLLHQIGGEQLGGEPLLLVCVLSEQEGAEDQGPQRPVQAGPVVEDAGAGRRAHQLPRQAGQVQLHHEHAC